MEFKQTNKNEGDVSSRYVLPGKYAYVERYEERERIITFQTLQELKEYLGDQYPPETR